MKNKTKIVATIGPASSSVPMLRKMIKQGLAVARINFSHGTHESNLESIKKVRQASKAEGASVAVCADLQGPKIRVVGMKSELKVTPGKKLVIGKGGDFEADEDIAQWVRPGQRLLIEDGLLEFEILKVSKVSGKVTCKVINGDAVRPRKTINLPDTHINLPCLTKKDKEDLAFALKQDVDFVALSFVRTAKDVELARKFITANLPKGIAVPQIISKIERPEAVSGFDEVLKATDAVMVARGDLGVEMPEAKVPVIQKIIVRKCLEGAKPVIVATQMLQSMTENPRPTRAEVSDVANAVLDRSDCVMLSGETSTGKYPLESVTTMSSIIHDVETSGFLHNECLFVGEEEEVKAAAVAGSACKLSVGVGATTIIGLTETGYTARFLAHQRPHAQIIMLTHSPRVYRQMQMLWGVRPLLMSKEKATDKLIDKAVRQAKKAGLISKGEKVVVVAGKPVGSRINIVEVKTVV